MEMEAAAPLKKVNSGSAGGQQHLQPSVRVAADNSSQLTPLHRFIQRQQAACLSTEIESSASRYLITLHRTVKRQPTAVLGTRASCLSRSCRFFFKNCFREAKAPSQRSRQQQLNAKNL